MEKKFITEERLSQLENSIAFLSNYINPDSQEVFVVKKRQKDVFAESNIDLKKTQALRKLSEINQQRLALIDNLSK